MKPLTFNVDTENKNRQPFVGNAASLMTAMMKPQHQHHPPQQQQQQPHMTTTMYPYRTSANTAGLVMGLDSREPLERQVEPSTTMMMMNHTTSQNHSALSNKIMTTVMKPTAAAVVVDPAATTRKIRQLETKWHEAQAQCGRLETELATLRHTCTATQQTLEAQLAERDALITKLEADLQQAQQDALPRKRDERDARRKEAVLAARVAELERELAAALEEQQTKNPPPPASSMERRARRSSNDRPVNYNESAAVLAETGGGAPISPDYEYEEMSVPPRGGAAASGASASGALTNVPRRRSSAMKQPTLSALSTMNANEKVFLAIPEYEGRINERYYVTGLHYWVFKAPDDTQRRAMVCCHCGSTKSFATAELFAKSMSHLTLHLIRNCPNIPKADIDQIPGKAATRPLMDMPMYAKRVWKQNVPTWNVLGMEPNKRGGFSGMGAQMSDDASSSLDTTATKVATTTRRASLPLANTTNHNHHHQKKVLQVSTTVESAADLLCLLASGQTMRETTSKSNKNTHSNSQTQAPDSQDDEDEVRHVLLAQPEHKGILSPRYFLTGMHFYVYTSPEDSRRRVMKCRHCAFTASYASVDIMTLSMAHLPRHLMRTCQGISLEEKQRIEQCTPGARGTIAMKTYVEQIWKRKVPVLDVTELQQYALQHDQPELAENNEPDSAFSADDVVVEAAVPRVKDVERKLADKVPSASPVERSISKEMVAGKAKATPLTHSAMAGPSELLQASLDNLDQQVLLSLPENEGVIRSRYYLTGLHFWVLTPRGEPARRIMLCRWCGATKSFASVDQLHKSIAHLSLHLLRHCPHCPDESKNQIAACPQREDAQMDLPTFAKQVWKREVPLCDMPRSGTGMLTSGGGKPKSWQQQQKATTAAAVVPVEAVRPRPKRGAKHLGSGDNDDASKRARVDVACEDNATILKRLSAMPNSASLKYPVGTTFTKHFPGIGSYSGKVVGHDGIFYLIEYADKDEEDMSEQELDALITAVPTTLPSNNMIQEDAGGSMNNAENKALRSPAAAAAARKPLPSVY